MLRLAVLGLGRAAEDLHLPAARAVPGVEVVAAADPDAGRREAVGRRFAIPRCYADPGALFDLEPVDLAVVAAPPDAHETLTRLALARGAHVLCEKPFVERLEDADRLIALAEARRLRLAVNHQYRFMDLYRVPAERIRSGRYGPLYLVEAWQHLRQDAAARGWRGGLRRSTLFEFGGHVLDLVLWLLGGPPEAVACQMPPGPAGATAEPVVHLALRFPGERLATVMLHRASHAPARYLEMRLSCAEAALRLSLGGVARATVEVSRSLGRPAARLWLAAGGLAREERRGRSRPLVREGRDPYRRATARLLAALVADIERGGPGPVWAREARQVLQVVEAAYESARTGLTVSLAPAAV